MKATHTPLRSVRIGDDLWNAARAAAKERDESLSDVIRDALERYIKRRGLSARKAAEVEDE